MMIYLFAFFLYLISDYVWALCISATSSGRFGAAGGWAAALHLLHALGVLVVVASPWACIPMAIGGGIGTLLATLNKRQVV